MTAPERGITAVVDKPFRDGFANVPEFAEAGEIGTVRACQIAAYRVMEFVQPLSVERMSAGCVREKNANVVEIAFGDDPSFAPQAGGLCMKAVAQFRQNMSRAEIEDAV